MERKVVILALCIAALIALNSCNSASNLIGSSYRFKSKKRLITILFTGDTTCVLSNFFICNGLESKYREINIECTFTREGDMIIVNNIECPKNSICNFRPFIEIPPQDSCDCYFLTAEARLHPNLFGPAYATEFEKYGLIPNIDQDTIYIANRKLLFFKNDERRKYMFAFSKYHR